MFRLETTKLDIAYEERLIVEDLNIQIPQGKITALVGANGSGKSTILKTMARIMAQKQVMYCSTGSPSINSPRVKLPSNLRFCHRIQQLLKVLPLLNWYRMVAFLIKKDLAPCVRKTNV